MIDIDPLETPDLESINLAYSTYPVYPVYDLVPDLAYDIELESLFVVLIRGCSGFTTVEYLGLCSLLYTSNLSMNQRVYQLKLEGSTTL